MKRLIKNVNTRLYGAVVLALLLSSHSQAGIGTSLMQGADLVPIGEVEARFQSDFIFNNGGGINVSGHFRTGLIQDFFDIGAFVGTGKTNLQAGAQTKFNLLPDLPGQIALSFMGGASLLKDDLSKEDEDDTFFALHSSAIISKNFVTSFGDIDPYAAFQFEAVFIEEENLYPLSAVFGVEWKMQATRPFHLFTEVGFSIDDSLSMFSAGASYTF